MSVVLNSFRKRKGFEKPTFGREVKWIVGLIDIEFKGEVQTGDKFGCLGPR
jgi:hypothetical protein